MTPDSPRTVRPARRNPDRLTTAALVASLLAGGCSGGGSEAAAAAAEGGDLPVFPAQNRPDVRGTRGAVSSDHPLASAVGYQVLLEGGNAVDAAVAMAAVLAVVRPHMNGVGGDAFAIFYEGETGQVTALNGSGRAGALATPAFFAERGLEEVPGDGALSVSVPGAVAAWVDALERFGTRSLRDLMQPAIAYARDGFPVSTRLAADFREQGDGLNAPGKALYLPGGDAPRVGSLLRNPTLAGTLETIAARGKAGFYEGEVARRLGAFLEAEGGYLRAEDLAGHTSTWVEPLSTDYLGHTFYVLPPNTQGVAQLAQMDMAKHFDLKEMGFGTSRYLHTQVEIIKRAFADRDRWVGDPEHAHVPVERMLDPGYLEERARGISMDRAAEDVPSGIEETSEEAGRDGSGEGGEEALPDDSGDTVYLTVVDQWGNAVSWIQSLFAGFGSGLFEPETGIMLQNRGALFTLEEGHPNRIAPGKRPYHTLSPTMALRDGRLAFTLGTPGGDSQTQSIMQIVHALLVFGMTPQEAVEAPRFRSSSGLSLSVEDRFGPDVQAELAVLGHRVRVIHGWTATFGGAQMILVDPVSGSLAAAADPRREAYAIAY